MKYYVGLPQRETFRAAKDPTQKTHGDQYAAVVGPFRTKRGAEFLAKYGHNNPHIQHVNDAETLATAEVEG